jgi:hypothetical protein
MLILLQDGGLYVDGLVAKENAIASQLYHVNALSGTNASVGQQY